MTTEYNWNYATSRVQGGKFRVQTAGLECRLSLLCYRRVADGEVPVLSGMSRIQGCAGVTVTNAYQELAPYVQATNGYHVASLGSNACPTRTIRGCAVEPTKDVGTLNVPARGDVVIGLQSMDQRCDSWAPTRCTLVGLLNGKQRACSDGGLLGFVIGMAWLLVHQSASRRANLLEDS